MILGAEAVALPIQEAGVLVVVEVTAGAKGSIYIYLPLL